MKSIARSFLGYLVVLNDEETLTKLNEFEIDVGRQNMMGCLHDVIDHLKTTGNQEVLHLVSQRERVNGVREYGHPELVEHTEKCAPAVLTVYEDMKKPL